MITAKEKLHDLTIFLYTQLSPKELNDRTAKKKILILLRMHASNQCAQLWATADFVPRSKALGTP